MIGTQIQRTEEQHRRLRRRARRLGVSISEAERRCVDEPLAREEDAPDRAQLRCEARAVFGRCEDPSGARVAEDPDRPLADAFRR